MVKLPSQLPWSAYIDGEDIVVPSLVLATWFGGPNDPEDGGDTSSGVSTIEHPDIVGCALPVEKMVKGRYYAPTGNSPIAFDPHIAWKTRVEVTHGKKTISVPLIDNGPRTQRYPDHAIDLTQAAFKLLGGDLKVGHMVVTYRIVGGAKYSKLYTTRAGAPLLAHQSWWRRLLRWLHG